MLNVLEKFCKVFFTVLFLILFIPFAVTPVGLAFLILWGMCSKKNEPEEKLQNNISNIYWSSCSNNVKRRKKIIMYNDGGYKFEIVI